MNWDALLNETFWINLAIVLGITIASFLVLRTILGIVTRRLSKLAVGSKTKFLGIATLGIDDVPRLVHRPGVSIRIVDGHRRAPVDGKPDPRRQGA